MVCRRHSHIYDWYFQQDGDAKHTSKVVQDWLAHNVVGWFQKDEWPANSPDLNVIENGWSVVWQELYTKKMTTKEQLKAAIKAAWKKKMTPEYCQTLFDSIPRRMDAVIAGGGLPTKY